MASPVSAPFVMPMGHTTLPLQPYPPQFASTPPLFQGVPDQYSGNRPPAQPHPQAIAASPPQTSPHAPTSVNKNQLRQNALLGAGLAGAIGTVVGATQGAKELAPQPGQPRQYYDKTQDRTLEIIPRQKKSNGELEIDRIVETDPATGKVKARVYYGRETENLVSKGWGSASGNNTSERMARVVLPESGIEAQYIQKNAKLDVTHIHLPNGSVITANDARAIVNAVPTLDEKLNDYQLKIEKSQQKQFRLVKWCRNDPKHHLTTDEYLDMKQLNYLKGLKDSMGQEAETHLKNLLDTRSNVELPDAATLLAKSVSTAGESNWKSLAKNVVGKGALGALIGATLGVAATIASKTLVAANPSKTLSPKTQPTQLATVSPHVQPPSQYPYSG